MTEEQKKRAIELLYRLYAEQEGIDVVITVSCSNGSGHGISA